MEKVPARFATMSLVLLLLISLASTAYGRDVTKVLYGSCNSVNLPVSPLWQHIVAERPDVWIWGGDNVYADRFKLDWKYGLPMEKVL